MKKGRYGIGEVRVGDSAFFSAKGINNLQRYWKVSGIPGQGMVTLTVENGGAIESLSIHVSDIQVLNRAGVGMTTG